VISSAEMATSVLVTILVGFIGAVAVVVVDVVVVLNSFLCVVRYFFSVFWFVVRFVECSFVTVYL